MMDLQKEIEKLKVKAGYDGKPQQWQYGFDLACRELAKAQAVPDGFVLMPKEPTQEIIQAGLDVVRESWDDNPPHGFNSFMWGDMVATWEAMIEAKADADDQITVSYERLQELIAIGVKAAQEPSDY